MGGRFNCMELLEPDYYNDNNVIRSPTLPGIIRMDILQTEDETLSHTLLIADKIMPGRTFYFRNDQRP